MIYDPDLINLRKDRIHLIIGSDVVVIVQVVLDINHDRPLNILKYACSSKI